MSTTFTVPNAPHKTIPCRWCAEYKDGGAEMNEHGGYCDPWCPGTVQESEAPEANMASANAESILTLLGIPYGQGYGEVEVADLRQRILKARNQPKARDAFTFQPYVQKGGHAGFVVAPDEETGIPRLQRRGAGYVNGGCSDEQLMRRLGDLSTLAQWAQDNGHSVIRWS